MIFLDYQDRRPLYEQITEKFRQLILNGAMEAGTKMPSVRQLAMELSINPNTIQRAYMELEQQGLIYPVRGRGNFVADTAQIRAQNRQGYEKELKNLVEKGRNIGVKKEEIIELIHKFYKGASQEE